MYDRYLPRIYTIFCQIEFFTGSPYLHRRRSLYRADIWNNPVFTDCIFYLKKRKDDWEPICYPGNNQTDRINPKSLDSCRLIDGECYKVHKDKKFLSSTLSKLTNKMLKCLNIADECFLKDEHSLLYNENDCYEPPCIRLAEDPSIFGNYCDMKDCGHSNSNLRGILKFKANKSWKNGKSKSKPWKIIDKDLASPLFKTLKDVVPKENLEENPTAVIYSIGLMYNDSKPTSSQRRRSDQTDLGKNNLSVVTTEVNGTEEREMQNIKGNLYRVILF